MAFAKFKLGKTNERTTPVPIAAALPRLSSTQNNDHVEHESSSKFGRAHDLLAPTRDQRFRCSKRRDPRIQNEAICSCSECQVSHTQFEEPVTGSKINRLGKMERRKHCPVVPSPQVASQTISLSAGGNLQAPHMLTPSPLQEERLKPQELDPSPEKEAPAAFQMGLDEAGLSSSRSARPWKQRLDYMIDLSFAPAKAEQVFHQYIGKLAPTCPVVVFPPGTTAGYVRKTKPLLFLSILSVASAGLCPLDQQRQFALDARNFLAETAIFKGEKSLELVQALLVVSFWYRAPESYAQMNQNQLASVTLSIAIDLGLDRMEDSRTLDKPDDMCDRAEAQRAWLGCFYLCASLSLIMRRPNPIFWTSKLDEYLKNLEQSRLSSTDIFLCRILRAEYFSHSADKEFFLSDPSSSISLWEPKTLGIVQDLQCRIDGLPLGHPNSLQKSLVEFGRSASSLYAHELALHVNHNIDEFKAPFSAKSLKSCNFVEIHAPNTTHLSMIRTIIVAAQGLLNAFLGLSTSEMLALPPHIYAGRVIYAVTLLTKLHKALSTSVSGPNESIRVDQLTLEAYIERLVLISKRLNSEDGRSSLSRAFLIMPQLKEWLHSQVSKSAAGPGEFAVEGGFHVKPRGGSPVPAISNRTDTPNPLPTAAGMPDRTSLDGSGALGEPGSRSDDPDVHGRGVEKEVETSRQELSSDSWFWEFFNTDMLQ